MKGLQTYNNSNYKTMLKCLREVKTLHIDDEGQKRQESAKKQHTCTLPRK